MVILDCTFKTCTRCGETKPLDSFAMCRGKHRARCKPCHSKDAVDWTRKNPERYKTRLKKWYQLNVQPAFMGPPLPEDEKKRRKQRYAQRTKAKQNEQKKAWAKKNPHVGAEIVRRRQIRIKTALPKWANVFFMQEVYHLARLRTKALRVPHEVDHIVPILGKTVCGLHCEANLQVLPKSENRAKGRYHWPDMP